MITHRTLLSACLFVLLALIFTSCDMNGTGEGEVTGLRIASGDGTVTLSWNDPEDGNLDHIEITWTPNDPAKPLVVDPGVEEAAISGLNNGTEYNFTVFSVDTEDSISEGVEVKGTPAVAGDFYVTPDGDNGNPGTRLQPWRTVQKAADTVPAGSTVFVREGIYNEQVTLRVSGSAAAGFITVRNFEGETPTLDGTRLQVPDDQSGMFLIIDQSYIIIQGFEIRNYRSSERDSVPIGITIRGTAHHIEIRNNRIHDVATTAPVDFDLSGADAHGIAVFGTSAPASVNTIIIEGNELYDMRLGSSEALVLNGNVEDFVIASNILHDVNNIGIDIIGFEGTAPDPAFDQARDGVIRDNSIYNASSFGNPSYGNEYSAGGIYIDGGRDIIIERNTVYGCDIGVEIASENRNRSTSGIVVRNNFLYDNFLKGISMGGYDRLRGSTEDCVIVNNTLYNNNTLQDGSGEIGITFDTRNNVIKNNIFYANGQGLFIDNNFTENSGNVVDYNIYFSSGGSNGREWEWKDKDYTDFDAYRAATGNDAHSLFIDPEFVDMIMPDLHLQSTSPAIDAGEDIPDGGEKDRDGGDRVQGSAPDIGADEYQP